MGIGQYQELAARTINQSLATWQLQIHAIMGLASEAGQVASMYQHKLQGKEIDVTKLAGEIGDVAWFVAEVCTAYGLDMEQVMRANIDKLVKRYPDGFSEYRSEHRHEFGED